MRLTGIHRLQTVGGVVVRASFLCPDIWTITKGQQMNKTATIIELLNAGKTAREVAELVECNISNVYATAKRNGIIPKHISPNNKVDAHRDEIRSMIADGVTYHEISRRLGLNRNTVRSFCRKNGITLRPDQIATNRELNAEARRNTDKNIKEKLLQHGLIYLGGYVNNATPVKAQCIKCGYVRDVKTAWIYGCPNCRRIKTEEAAVKREAEKQKRIAEKTAERERKELEAEKRKARAEKRKRHKCPVCGAVTTRTKYCSDICQKRAYNQRKEIKRRQKISNVIVDHDITIEKLYQRDHGQCYICGMLCSWDDHTVKNGAFISGDWYPSIDHVVPLAKGGKHAWDNVKLAHRRCNYLKRDLKYPPSA